MTKHSPRKQAIRTYMATHAVNYTTAARALDAAASDPVSDPGDLTWTHCRWNNTHPPLLKDGTFTPRVRATGKPGAECATCGEALTTTQVDDVNLTPRVAVGIDLDPNYAAVTRTRLDNLKAALATGHQDTINTALRTGAPGPDPWDLTYALASLADNDTAMHEHTDDPETPVTAHVLRLAVHATATHGHHRTGGRWWPTANDVCRAALLGLPITAAPDAPKTDEQHPVDPTDLAAVLDSLADNQSALNETAHGTAVTSDHLAEALLLLAADLNTPTTVPDPATMTASQHLWSTRPDHYLLVTTEPLTAADRADLTTDDLNDYRYAPDRDYTIDCPGIAAAGCEGWEECGTCRFLDEDQASELEETGIAHGQEHQHTAFGWATVTGECSLTAFPDAWIDSATDLDLPPGRYAITYDWNEGCDLSLVTR